jgi:hypothetical protein
VQLQLALGQVIIQLDNFIIYKVHKLKCEFNEAKASDETEAFLLGGNWVAVVDEPTAKI